MTYVLTIALLLVILFAGFAAFTGIVYFAWALLALTALVSPPTVGYSAAVAGVLWFTYRVGVAVGGMSWN
jgi:hypothetical protein